MKHTFPGNDSLSRLRPRKESKVRMPPPLIERLALIPLLLLLPITAAMVVVLS